MFLQRGKVVFDRIVDADINDIEAGAFHHHADKILADIMNVAFHRTDDHLAHLRCACFRQ